MSGVLGGRRHTSDTGKAVKYTPCAKADHTDEEELAEVTVVSSTSATTLEETPIRRPPRPSASPNGGPGYPDRDANDEDATDDTSGGSGSGHLHHHHPHHHQHQENDDQEDAQSAASVAANGPRVLPPPATVGELFRPVPSSDDRTKLIGERLSSTGKINVSSPVYSGRVVEQKSTSKQSLLEIVTHKLDRVRGRKSSSFSKEEVSYVNKAHTSDVMTPREVRKQRRKEIEEKFGKKYRNAAKAERIETSTTSSEKDGCKWTFVFDPSGRLAYWWSFVVSVAFIYNFWVLIYRFSFEEINEHNIAIWFTLDYLADLLYILDIAFHFRTGYLEDGVLQTDGTKLRIHYMNSTMFYIDCLCLLPLDFLYLSIGYKSMLRCFRLVKIYRFWAYIDRTERHTNYPNLVRTVTLLHYLFAVYHWNACLVYLVTKQMGDRWHYPPEDADVLSKYLHSLYWSTLALTTIGDLPGPKTDGERLFVIVEFVFGLLLFSTILGHVANIVTSISTARKDFQAKLDSVKTYMMLRRVPLRLQDRVIKWFDYLWLSKKSSDEERTLNLLPDKLKAEIALHVHLDTLKRVEIFQNTEAGFLCELVLKLRPVLFSPSDYICRKGEVGKEMYIVSRGRLQVVADNGRTVLATLRAGSYFGEISILNMGNAGNRRTASVRSVGYSDLFCLSKNDLWEVLKDYPTARVRLEAIAVKRLEKYKKAPLEQVALPRSKSTPGLLESSGKIPLENMMLCRSSLPSTMMKPHVGVSRTPDRKLSNNGLGGSGSGMGVGEPSYHRTPSSHGSRHGSVTAGSSTGNMAAGDTQETGCGITNSMTISSITSYVTDGSGGGGGGAGGGNGTHRSPTGTVEGAGGHADSPASRTQSAGSGSRTGAFTTSPSASTATVGVESFQRPASPALFSHGGAHSSGSSGGSGYPQRLGYSSSSSAAPPDLAHHHLQQQQQHALPVFTTMPQAPYPTPLAQPTPHPPPFSAAAGSSSLGAGYPTAFPASGAGLVRSHSPMSSSSHSFNAYHTYPPGGAPGGSLLASSSVGSLSLSREPQNEQLLQEITRLRERLQSLESENATMSVKLNQQQWEVENRLAEIEMHICGSDHSCSESEVGNKESVI